MSMSNRMQAPHPPAEQNSSQAPAPVNLPPIHHFPPQHQQMQSQPPPYTTPMSSNGAPPPPPQHVPPYPPPQYQYQNGAMPPAMQPGVPASGQNGMMRIPLPHAQLDSRQMSGGRHKKEIKRRTKTGCLTCRKRRIKCDEGQPTCRNCSKSKRECLGYDPIFKQQPGPANIQPAPIGNPASSATHPATALHYHQPPQSFPGTGGTFIPAAASAPPGYEYGGGNAPLDPALSGGDPSAHMAHNNYSNPLQPLRKVKMFNIEDLFALNDIPPRYNSREAPPPVSAAVQQDMAHFFKFHYAQGLDRFFETSWYSQRGSVLRDPALLDFVIQCAEQFKQREDANAKPTISLEARLVWQLAMMPRTAASQANGAGLGTDPLLQEVLPRLDVVEYLLSGQFLDPSRIPPPPQQQPPEPGQESSSVNQKYNERAFWHHLGRFVTLRDDTPSVQKDIDDNLSYIRNMLGMLENRDVLYSVAIGRHIGGRMPDFHPQRHLVASNNDHNDPVTKLSVAQTFVESEEQRGTNQIIQRICSMAIRGWILQKR